MNQCSETSLKGKIKVVDAYLISFDDYFKNKVVAECSFLILGDMVDFHKMSSIKYISCVFEI